VHLAVALAEDPVVAEFAAENWIHGEPVQDLAMQNSATGAALRV
jgi:hypothetical protein